MDLPRSAGVLLHVGSLPGGRLGPEARRLVAWMGAAGFRWWQVLPICPPGAGGSPYDSPSAFALDPAMLEAPNAPVGLEEERAFREREAYWVEGHVARYGEASIADQVRCEREWARLREVARSHGIRLIGDLPIYVSAQGVERETRPWLFADGIVGGVPPDAFAEDGQRWGNPVYDWEAMAADGYRWWTERLRRACALTDLVRLDHFRAFAGYWAIPADEPTARGGAWRPGPGAAPFGRARQELGDLPLIAEDLGIITDDVHALREHLGLPTIRVLQFGFESDDSPHRPRHLPEWCVAYTGTHDNDTLAGWLADLPDDQRGRLSRELLESGLDPAPSVAGCIDLLLRSPARVAVTPAQDLLGLGSEARMNRPGTLEGNWSWRLAPGTFDDKASTDLRRRLVAAGRG